MGLRHSVFGADHDDADAHNSSSSSSSRGADSKRSAAAAAAAAAHSKPSARSPAHPPAGASPTVQPAAAAPRTPPTRPLTPPAHGAEAAAKNAPAGKGAPAAKGTVAVDAIWASVLNSLYALLEHLQRTRVLAVADVHANPPWLGAGVLGVALLDALVRSVAANAPGIHLAAGGEAVTEANCPPQHTALVRALLLLKSALAGASFTDADLALLRGWVLRGGGGAGAAEPPQQWEARMPSAQKRATCRALATGIAQITAQTTALPFWGARFDAILQLFGKPAQPQPQPAASAAAAAAAGDQKVAAPAAAAAAPAAAAAQWTCFKCTFAENAAYRLRCELCESPRDDAKAAAAARAEAEAERKAAADAKANAFAAANGKDGAAAGLDDIWESVLNRCYHVATHAVTSGLITLTEVEDQEPFLYFGLVGATVLDALHRSLPLPQPDAIALADRRVVTLRTCPPDLTPLMQALVGIRALLHDGQLNDAEWDGLRKRVLWAQADGKPEVVFGGGDGGARAQLCNRAAAAIQSVVTQVTQMRVFKERFASVLQRVAERKPPVAGPNAAPAGADAKHADAGAGADVDAAAAAAAPAPAPAPAAKREEEEGDALDVLANASTPPAEGRRAFVLSG